MNVEKRGRFRIALNVAYELKDSEGRPKPIFQWNKLGVQLFKVGLITPFNRNPLFGSWQLGRANYSNLITNAGMAGVASRINGAGSEAAFTYIAIGTGTTAADATDTALETEITTNGGERASASASRTTTDVTNDTSRLVNTFNFTGSFAVTESGVLNAGASGVLLCHQVFSAINVTNGDSLQVTWDIDVD